MHERLLVKGQLTQKPSWESKRARARPAPQAGLTRDASATWLTRSPADPRTSVAPTP